jgi:signal transduction histidine kinase
VQVSEMRIAIRQLLVEAFAGRSNRWLSLVVMLAFHMFMPLLAGIILFSSDRWQRHKTASYFTTHMRNDVLRGSKREAMITSQNIVGNSGPFVRVQLLDKDENLIFDLKNEESGSWLTADISTPIFFTEIEDEVACLVRYSYTYQGVLYVYLIFLALSLSLSFYVSHRQKIRFERKHLLDVEDQKTKAVARAVKSLAHDLKAPLNLIEIALSEYVHKENSEASILANQGLHRIYAMIDGLKSSDLDAFIKIKKSELDLQYIFMLAEGLSMQFQRQLYLPGVQKVTGYFDAPKLERCIQNLLVNAFEASNSYVKLLINRDDNGTLNVSVLDDGPGVPKEINGKLFQKGTTFGKIGGTGLGLDYVRSIIVGHGGEVTYVRTAGESVFSINLFENHHEQDESSEAEILASKAELVIYIDAGDKSTTSYFAEECNKLPNCRAVTEVDKAANCHLALVSGLDELEMLPEGRRHVVFFQAKDSREGVVEKIALLVHQMQRNSEYPTGPN